MWYQELSEVAVLPEGGSEEEKKENCEVIIYN